MCKEGNYFLTAIFFFLLSWRKSQVHQHIARYHTCNGKEKKNGKQRFLSTNPSAYTHPSRPSSSSSFSLLPKAGFNANNEISSPPVTIRTFSFGGRTKGKEPFLVLSSLTGRFPFLSSSLMLGCSFSRLSKQASAKEN